ncbi:hypothetical protein FRC08_009600 [Ceratobasidium sp. 394]|nr:hypothetical protein FRC08_009600 [Ceratobasidium sp. 394]
MAFDTAHGSIRAGKGIVMVILTLVIQCALTVSYILNFWESQTCVVYARWFTCSSLLRLRPDSHGTHGLVTWGWPAGPTENSESRLLSQSGDSPAH